MSEKDLIIDLRQYAEWNYSYGGELCAKSAATIERQADAIRVLREALEKISNEGMTEKPDSDPYCSHAYGNGYQTGLYEQAEIARHALSNTKDFSE